MVNGTPFQPTSCRSGQAYGFVGVELTNAEGASLRFVQTPMNIPQVIYIASPGAPATLVGTCGVLSVQQMNSTINRITNIEGVVTPQCAGTINVAGSLRFANCH